MKLSKELSLIGIFCISTGAMISSGIFILPGIAFTISGPSLFISYLIAGLMALTGALSIAELSSAMPKSGGDYYFITRSLGPMVGTVSGMMSWLALTFKTAFALVGIAEILHVLLGVDITLSYIVSACFFTFINIIGAKESSTFQIVIVVSLIFLMLLYVVVGISSVSVQRFEPFTPNGFNSTVVTAGFVFVSYGGLLKVASASEEVINPKRDIPLGISSALLFVAITYTMMIIVTVGVLEPSQLSGSLTPIADAARAFMGNFGYGVMTIAAMLAFISTGNAGIFSAARYPYALSKDGLLPEIFAYVHARFRTPFSSIILTGLLLIICYKLPLEMLVKVASTTIMLTYILACISVIILRESRVQNYRPAFKSPLYPWAQLVGIFAFILLMLDMGVYVLLSALGFVMLALVIYFVYGRNNNTSESGSCPSYCQNNKQNNCNRHT